MKAVVPQISCSVFWMPLVMASGVLVNFLSDPHSSRHKVCPYMIYCSDFFKVYVKSSSFRKEQLYLLVTPSQEAGRKIGNFSFQNCSHVRGNPQGYTIGFYQYIKFISRVTPILILVYKICLISLDLVWLITYV